MASRVKLATLATSAVGIVLVAVGVATVGPGRAGAAPTIPGPLPVTVENTPSSPVPTTTEVLNAVDHPVPIRNVEEDSRQVFTQIVDMHYIGTLTQMPFLTVEPGRRAVVEYVSCSIRAAPGAHAMASLLLPNHEVAFPLVKTLTNPFANGLDEHTGDRQMRLYLEAGTGRTYDIKIEVDQVNFSGAAGSCSVSGYLTDKTRESPPLPI